MGYQMTVFDNTEYHDHLEQIHITSDGWVTVANKNGDQWKQRHYHVNDLLDNPEIINELNEYNSYISQNTFYKPYRRIECLKELKTLYVDIDTYNTGYSKSQARMAIEYMATDGEIPRPNLIIDSGRGLYCVWTIKPEPQKALPSWQAVENYLYTKIKKYGADAAAKDATRVLRIAGTWNSKSNSKVTILDSYKCEYTLYELIKEYIPELHEYRQNKQNNKKQATGRPKQTIYLYNLHSLRAARIHDITKICELRQWNMTGQREITLFLYRYWVTCFKGDPSEALKDTLELNREFTEPLSEREAERATQTAERAYNTQTQQNHMRKKQEDRYKYTNQKIIDLLGIDEEEQTHLKTIIGRKEKYRRNNIRRQQNRRNDANMTAREQAKADKEEQIKALILQGLNKTEIARRVGISRAKLYSNYGYIFK